VKRSPSATHSYLHRLAEPVPPRTALLTTHGPAYRGQSVREAIPPILDSVSDPVTSPQASPRTIRTRRMQTPPSQAFPVDVSNRPANSSARAATDANPLAEAHSSASVASDTPIAAQRGGQTIVATLTSDKVRPDLINVARESLAAVPEAFTSEKDTSSKSEDPRQSHTDTPTTATHNAAAVSSRKEQNANGRDKVSRVHIGTVEVRTAAPVREPQPAPAIDRRFLAGRSALAAEPLSRPLAWSHGLVQG
jgi:hypothetical protein